MKTMIVAFVAIAVIAVGSNLILENVGFSSAERQATSDVRLTNPSQ